MFCPDSLYNFNLSGILDYKMFPFSYKVANKTCTDNVVSNMCFQHVVYENEICIKVKPMEVFTLCNPSLVFIK